MWHVTSIVLQYSLKLATHKHLEAYLHAYQKQYLGLHMPI